MPVVVAKGSKAINRGSRKLFAEFSNTQINRVLSSSGGERDIMHSTHGAPMKEKLGVISHPNVETNIYQNVAGAPEIVSPVTHFSPYTKKDKYTPVTFSFAGAKGCDLQLFKLVEKLMNAGLVALVEEVLMGKVPYPGQVAKSAMELDGHGSLPTCWRWACL